MNWDVCLKYENEIAQVGNHEEGGTYVLGGTTDADLNITYNYSNHFYATFPNGEGILYLHGKNASSTIDCLERAIKMLGTKQNLGYWRATPGNAGYALSVLLKWAKQHPDAIWEVN